MENIIIYLIEYLPPNTKEWLIDSGGIETFEKAKDRLNEEPYRQCVVAGYRFRILERRIVDSLVYE